MRLLNFMLVLTLALTMVSCYSVRFQVENGQWEPEDTEEGDPYYRGYLVRSVPKKVVTKKLITGADYFNISDCESGALHTVEYKSTLGGILLNLITFGTKKQVKVRYVCIKKEPNI